MSATREPHLYVIGPSALEHWRRRGKDETLERSEAWACAPMLDNATVSAEYLAERSESLSCLRELSRPVHLLTDRQAALRHCPSVCAHLCTGGLPIGSFVEVGQDVFIATPEYTALSMARLGFVDLIVVLYELCGTYVLPATAEGYTSYDRQPICTTARLEEYANTNSHAYGSVRTRKALRHVRDGSASPMETILTLLLCMPSSQGGFGLPFPQLNVSVNDNQTPWGKVPYRIDLYWPSARLGLEYDSREYHSGELPIFSNARRRIQLRNNHVDVIPVYPRTVYEEAPFYELAHLVTRELGHRLRLHRSFEERSLWLRRKLNLNR